MSIDDLINNAFKDRGGHIEGSNLHALVGSVTTQETFVVNLNDFFMENFRLFLNGEDPKAVLIGAYTSEDAARKAAETIEEQGNHGSDLVYNPEWHVLIANIHENRLYPMSLLDYYIGGLAFYKYRVDHGILVLGIFDRIQATEDVIDFIRHSIKDENGNIL